MRTFLNDERGTTTIEYTAIAALLSIVVFVAADRIGGWLSTAVDPALNALR
jgi:Flp pilus assembly pilin Flp